MGADIHLSIENKADNGTWHCIWHGSLIYTQWYRHRVLQGKPHSIHRDPTPMEQMEERDYSLFGLLSGVRWDNTFAVDNIGDVYNGILSPVMPDTLSYPSTHLALTDHYHSASWATLGALRDFQQAIQALSEKTDKQQGQAETFDAWLASLDASLLLLRHPTKPFLGHVVGSLPSNETDGQDYDIFQGRTAHETLANHHAWDFLLPPNSDTIRVVAAYDS